MERASRAAPNGSAAVCWPSGRFDFQPHQQAAQFVVDVAGDALAFLLARGFQVEGKFRQLLARGPQAARFPLIAVMLVAMPRAS